MVDIYLDTKKSKEVKEKNINNEITKYQITITSAIRVKELIDENIFFQNRKNWGLYCGVSIHKRSLMKRNSLMS